MQDAYGLTVSAGSADARDAYDRAVHGLLGWDGGTLELFQGALAGDPELALAHAGAGICHVLDERFPEARAAVARARAGLDRVTARERSHVEAVALWVDGQPDEAARAMREHLATWPRDLVIAQRLFFIWFWQGKFPEMLELTASLAPAYGDGAFFLGLHAFALEEGRRFAEAARVAERALAHNPRDAWAVHALAHTLYDMGASDDGVVRLPPAIHPCTHLGWFRNHLLWHLALMHLALGHYDRTVRLSRRIFERRPTAIPGELHDSISLLWRLELLGEPVGTRWAPFAAIARERLSRQGLLFHSAHLAMALAGGDEWATAERQLVGLREQAAQVGAGTLGEVLVPLVEGLHAFARRDYAGSIARIRPLQSRLIELGGSRAQRDVFHDTLLEACFRAGDMDQAASLLAERVARRPDHAWVTRRSRTP